MATHTQPPRRQTPSPEGNATYKDFTKLSKWCFLLARINRGNSHCVSLPSPSYYLLHMDWRTLLPDGRILGRWTQKWPSKNTCGPENQRPRKWPNLQPDFNNLTINNLTNFFSSDLIFLAGLTLGGMWQQCWRREALLRGR